MVVRPLSAALLLTALGCGTATPAARSGVVPTSAAPSPAGRDPAQRYEVTTTVLESPEHGPELCVGGVRDSLPPQCGGVPVAPFSWDDVTGERSRNGTTWAGSVRLLGTFDGTTFHPTEPPSAPAPATGAPRPERVSPCPEPAGGWRDADPAKTSRHDQNAMIIQARNQPDVAGVWLTWPDGAPKSDLTDEVRTAVQNLSFTGDLERHEREAREHWGGPLCVTQAARTYASLTALSERIFAEREEAAAAGVHIYGGDGAREVENDVAVTVLIADDLARRWMDERYGADLVVLEGIFRPVG